MKWHRQRYVGLLLQAVLFVANCRAENLVFDVSLKKPIAVTDDAFLSLAVDPAMLLRNADDLAKNIVTSTNMARGLAPAYIRLGGPQSNSYIFERACSNGHDVDSDNMFCEMHWTLLHEWAQNAGLDVIACIAPQSLENESQSHSKVPANMEKFISFSDDMDYNVSLQLGYECQTRCDLSGEDLGRYVASLREILKNFPRYSNSLITGPDIVSYETTRHQKYIEDYLTAADDALSAITWHPNLAGASLSNGNIIVDYDNITAEKNELYKIIGRTAEKKPLWIAESKPEEYNHEYLGALVWTRRLGNVAKLGAQVVMRQPSNLHKTTPDYWVSLLHKRLVGREVLETRSQSTDSHVYLYAQCTKPSASYDRGAVTIFGVNFTPEKAIASLKGVKIKTLHAYILTSDSDKMSSEYVLLNNKPLGLMNDEELPDLNPEITASPDGLKLELPPASVGFWVIPDAKAKACADSEEKTVGSGAVRGKRRENRIRRENEERKEEPNHFDVHNRKTHVREERRKRKHVDNEESEGYQSAWGSKFLTRISKMLRKRLEQAGNSPKFQRSIRIDLDRKQGSSEEEDSSDRSEVGTVGDKSENIRDTTVRRYKHGEAESFGKGGRRRRRRRDLGKRLMEISARRDNRKNSRAVDARDYLNERRARRRDDPRKEGFVTPFNPRIVMSKTDSDENNFYGFFRQAPVKGFPESDVYGTVGGNSSEQTGADYDYVQDDENDDVNARSKNTRRFGGETSSENIWIEDEHSDYVPNEFFENVRLWSTGVRGNSMDYGDLWEAESFSAKATTEFADSKAQKSEPRPSVYSLDSASHAQNRPVQDQVRSRDARTKRHSEQLREILAEEMFKQDEGKDCQCRIIRNFDSPENTGNEIAKTTTDVRRRRSRRNVVGDLETRGEERGENTTGEATANESEKIDATTETPIEDTTRVIETTGVTSAAEESDAHAPVTTPVSSTPSEFSVTTDAIVTKQTFFPTRSPEIRSSGEETTALDNAQTLSTISANSAENWGRHSSAVSIGTANREKTENVIVEKKTTENVTFSAFAAEQRNESRYDENSKVIEYLGESMKTIDAKQTAAEMNMSKEDDEKVAVVRSPEMQSNETGTRDTSQSVSETIDDARQITTKINMLKEDDEKPAIARSPEIQSGYETTTAYDISRVTTETSVLKEEVADESIDNVKLGERAMKKTLRQKATDRNSESEVVALKKDADTSKSKITTSPTVHKVPLRKLTRYDEYLIRRAEQIDKKLRERFAKLRESTRIEKQEIADGQRRI